MLKMTIQFKDTSITVPMDLRLTEDYELDNFHCDSKTLELFFKNKGTNTFRSIKYSLNCIV